MSESSESGAAWYRLKGEFMGQARQGMRPVEQPVNHDGMDLSQLPPVREAFLSGAEVQQLFSDIENLGSDILLMQRPRRENRATAAAADSPPQLSQAAAALLGGRIPRLQIRYKWRGQNWIDTLESQEVNYRLIRIRHPGTP